MDTVRLRAISVAATATVVVLTHTDDKYCLERELSKRAVTLKVFFFPSGQDGSSQFLRAAGAPVRRRPRCGGGPSGTQKLINKNFSKRKPRENLAKTSRKPCENLAKSLTLRKPCENLGKTLRKPRENLAKTSQS